MAILSVTPVGGGTPVDVEYVHGIELFRKGVDQMGPYYTVSYHLDGWEHTDAFVNALTGAGTLQPAHQHPLSPNLLCMEAHVEGTKPVLSPSPPAVSGMPAYTGPCVVRAVYRSPVIGGGFPGAAWDPGWQHQIDPSDPILWATIELTSNTEVITHPSQSYVWASDSTPVTTPVQIDIGILIMSITFHKLTFLPHGPMDTYKNRIHNGAGGTFLGAGDELVWFQSYRTRMGVNHDGTATRDATLVFAKRDVSWNMLLRPDRMPGETGAWDYPQSAAGHRRFLKADLNTLLSYFR
jgi:hypothetical protein